MKVIIFSKTIEPNSLPQIDELEYIIVPDTTRLISAFASERGNSFVFINAESDEESVQEEFSKLREEFPEAYFILAIPYINPLRRLSSIYGSDIYHLFAGDLHTPESFEVILDIIKSPLEETLTRKSIQISSQSAIIDFDIEDLGNGGVKSEKEGPTVESEHDQQSSSTDGQLHSITEKDEASFGKGMDIQDISLSGVGQNVVADQNSEDPAFHLEEHGHHNSDEEHGHHNSDEEHSQGNAVEEHGSQDANVKHAFSALEKIVKNAIGFNSDNLEEIEKQQKENQEIEDMFSPDDLGETMSDDTLKPNENVDSEIQLDAGETKPVDHNDIAPDDLDGGMELNLEGDESGAGEDLGLEDLTDVGGMESSSEGDLEMPTDLDMGDLEMGEDSPTQDLSFDEGGDELVLGDDSDLGLDLEASSGDEINLDSSPEENSVVDESMETASVDESMETASVDESLESGPDEEILADFGGGDDSAEEAQDLDLSFGAGEENAEADDLSEESSDIGAVDSLENIDGGVDSSGPGESPDDEVFLAESDETGDIDIDAITSNNIEAEDLLVKSETDSEEVGEEFDYKTSMISASTLNFDADEELPEEVINEKPAEASESPSSSMDEEAFTISADSTPLARVDGDELMEIKAILETVRAERDEHEAENLELKKQIEGLKRERDKLKEEMAEVKIDYSITRQKLDKIRLENADQEGRTGDRLRQAEAKIRVLKETIENQKTSYIIDKQAVSKREKDLESKVELMEIDFASQLKSREVKILELKRKVETLEFNMETTIIQNQGLRENKKVLSERLKLVSESLRGAGRVLDDSIDLDDMIDYESDEKAS